MQLSIDDPEFRSQWYTYSRVVDLCVADPTALTNFWNKRSGTLARCAQFLINVRLTSADVECSFSLAGYMDVYDEKNSGPQVHLSYVILA